MNPQVKTALTVTGLAAAAFALIFIGWKAFGPAPGEMDQATVNAHIAAKNAAMSAHQFH